MIKYFFLIALMALSPTFSLAQEVRVLSVIDGDTLRVVDSEEQAIKIRLYGVDCPELGQHSGTRAKEFAKNILQNKRIMVQSQGKDRYGRTVAIVILEDGRSLQERLLRAGLAGTTANTASSCGTVLAGRSWSITRASRNLVFGVKKGLYPPGSGATI